MASPLRRASDLLDKLCRDTGRERAQSDRVVLPEAAPCQPQLVQPQHSPAPAHRHSRGGSGAQHSPLCAGGAVGSRQAQRTSGSWGPGAVDSTSPRGSFNILLSLLMGSMTPVLRIRQGTMRPGEMAGSIPCSPEASPSPHPDSVRLLGSLRGVCVWVSGFSVSVSCALIKAALLETAGGQGLRLPQDSQPYVSAAYLYFPGQETEVQGDAVAAPSRDLDPSRRLPPREPFPLGLPQLLPSRNGGCRGLNGVSSTTPQIHVLLN